MEIISQKLTGNKKNILSPTRCARLYRRSRLTAWHQGDYRELVLFVAASAKPLAGCRAYVWRVLEGLREIQSGIGTAVGLSEAASEELAAEAGRRWILANHPDAKIRVRSVLERRALFGDRGNYQRRRKAA